MGACVVLAAALAVLAGCSGKTEAQGASTTPQEVTLTKQQQRSIHVVTVEPAAYHDTIATTGVVDFDHDRAADLVAPISGAVTRVLVGVGDEVREGQALATVDSPDYAAAVGAYRKASLAAHAADSVAANDRALYAHQAISQRENDAAQADAAGADADLAAALQALQALHLGPKVIAAIRAGRHVDGGQGAIHAPIAGRVVAKAIVPGQAIRAGETPCFTIADTSKMWVMARLFGDDGARVHAGDTAAVDVGNGSSPVTGTVTNVGAVIDPDTRAVTARVEVDNPDGVLKKSMYVAVHIHSRDARNGILIPDSAVLRNDENLPFVYVVGKGGGYARRRVTLGRRVGERFAVSAGLHPGDRLVVDGGLFLAFIQTQ